MTSSTQAAPDETKASNLAAHLERLVLACRILAMEGHDDKTLGHMSMRDPLGRGFWIKRPGIALGEVDGAADFVLFDLDGGKLEGAGGRPLEWPIHGEIYRRHGDVGAIGHTHPFHATIFSASTAPLPPITHEACHFCGDVPRFTAHTGLVDTQELGEMLAECLGSANAVLQQNHGVTFVGTTIEQATMSGLMIEKACHQMLVLKSSGLEWTVPPADELPDRMSPMPDKLAADFFSYYLRRL